ncbi:hypothetical protein BDP55DRAFT_394775 [Colletotrichum godetiae]|uniref:BZIP domain-containing protein n=1 Tax=Colletotrichum godetiae TaxID=1209918 RepID=A0AAJ0A8N4_9PEZI|nr:uncharacterized protein BDP55DRAFT_394775 [Colletotrichum godetiae]KAK1658527.1 hypothetical protein BDP55DRAFT_394775 [Colletotrichum godetiae]
MDTLQQDTLQIGASDERFFNHFNDFTSHQTFQHQWTQLMFQNLQQMRLQQSTEHEGSYSSQVVTPLALTSDTEASQLTENRQYSPSKQSSPRWLNSSVNNHTEPLSSSKTSLLSSPSSIISSATEPPTLNPAKKTETLPPGKTGLLKRRRGRPRFSDTGMRNTRTVALTAAKEKQKAPQYTLADQMNGVDNFRHEHGDIDQKMNRTRSRNRKAAYKSRQKKQKETEELQLRAAELETVNKNRNSEAAMLRGEILVLKNMILQHSGCECSYIDEYISNTTRQLVESTIAVTASAVGVSQSQYNQPGTKGPGGERYLDTMILDMDPDTGVLVGV